MLASFDCESVLLLTRKRKRYLSFFYAEWLVVAVSIFFLLSTYYIVHFSLILSAGCGYVSSSKASMY